MGKVEGPDCFETTIWCTLARAKLIKGGLLFYNGRRFMFKKHQKIFSSNFVPYTVNEGMTARGLDALVA